LLTAESISQMFWDDSNHLYAISQSSGTLHVFTITPSAASEAPGSPYTLNQPLYIAVQDK
jgi:outer membrane protein assembly factor BamB